MFDMGGGTFDVSVLAIQELCKTEHGQPSHGPYCMACSANPHDGFKTKPWAGQCLQFAGTGCTHGLADHLNTSYACEKSPRTML